MMVRLVGGDGDANPVATTSVDHFDKRVAIITDPHGVALSVFLSNPKQGRGGTRWFARRHGTECAVDIASHWIQKTSHVDGQSHVGIEHKGIASVVFLPKELIGKRRKFSIVLKLQLKVGTDLSIV